MNKHIDINEAEGREELEIKDGIFFLPEDFEKFKDKGRWILHVKEGRLVKAKE